MSTLNIVAFAASALLSPLVVGWAITLPIRNVDPRVWRRTLISGLGATAIIGGVGTGLQPQGVGIPLSLLSFLAGAAIAYYVLQRIAAPRHDASRF